MYKRVPHFPITVSGNGQTTAFDGLPFILVCTLFWSNFCSSPEAHGVTRWESSLGTELWQHLLWVPSNTGEEGLQVMGWRPWSCSIQERKDVRNTLLLQTTDGLLWSKDAPWNPWHVQPDLRPTEGDLYKLVAWMTTAKKRGEGNKKLRNQKIAWCTKNHIKGNDLNDLAAQGLQRLSPGLNCRDCLWA